VNVTVVIPCYNASKWIEATLHSVLTQATPPEAVIVVDDGSTDDSRAIVSAAGGMVRLRTQDNAGACRARNVGLTETESTYVMFLDADDYIEGDLIGGALRALQSAEADVAFAPVVHERPGGSRQRVFHYGGPPDAQAVFSGWLNHYSQPPCSIVWRTDFVRSIGGWDDTLLKNQDGEFAMRAMMNYPVITSFEDGHGVYREHGESSVSRRLSPAALRSELSAMQALVDAAAGTPFAAGVAGFGLKFYIIARGAYQIGEPELAREALAAARAVGYRGHSGGFGHRVAANLLGLSGKMQLANMWHSFRRGRSK
jgi:glycosyltransferase involved in cell wall biosynthesis